MQREYGGLLFTLCVGFGRSDKLADWVWCVGIGMENLKQMGEDMYGKYTEQTDEKEIIRTCA
jgi:hypothetical protein